jgi:hypothetical protein
LLPGFSVSIFGAWCHLVTGLEGAGFSGNGALPYLYISLFSKLSQLINTNCRKPKLPQKSVFLPFSLHTDNMPPAVRDEHPTAMADQPQSENMNADRDVWDALDAFEASFDELCKAREIRFVWTLDPVRQLRRKGMIRFKSRFIKGASLTRIQISKPSLSTCFSLYCASLPCDLNKTQTTTSTNEMSLNSFNTLPLATSTPTTSCPS